MSEVSVNYKWLYLNIISKITSDSNANVCIFKIISEENKLFPLHDIFETNSLATNFLGIDMQSEGPVNIIRSSGTKIYLLQTSFAYVQNSTDTLTTKSFEILSAD